MGCTARLKAVPIQRALQLKSQSAQWEGRALFVARARRRQIALVQTELVRRHCTEVRRWRLFQLFANKLQAGCRTLATNGVRPSTAHTRESEMGSKHVVVALEFQGLKSSC